MKQPEEPSLAGYRVAVTAARRARELCTVLRRHGAMVASAPAISMIAMSDDEQLRCSTEALLHDPPDIVIITTGIGLRGWLAAAGEWGLADRLNATLSRTRIVARGPKATGAVRGCGPARRVVPGIGVLPRHFAPLERIRHQRLSDSRADARCNR